MPNWLLNEITIEGKSEDIERLSKVLKIDEGKFDFDQILPEPKELSLTIAPTTVVETQTEADEKNQAERSACGFHRLTPVKYTGRPLWNRSD